MTGPEGFRRSRFPDFKNNRHMKVVRLSTLRTGRLYPQETFLVFISVRGWVDSKGHSGAGRIMSMKIFNDTIGNHTRDLPACRAVPQRTSLPCARISRSYTAYFVKVFWQTCLVLCRLLVWVWEDKFISVSNEESRGASLCWRLYT